MPDNNELESEISSLKMPYKPESEQALLGAIIIDSECMSSVVQLLPNADYFYLHTHQLIYRVMLDLFSTSQVIDFPNLMNALRREPDFDESTGRTYVLELAQSMLTVENVTDYA